MSPNYRVICAFAVLSLLIVFSSTHTVYGTLNLSTSSPNSLPYLRPLTWLNETESAGPPPLAGHKMAFDTVENKFFLFGGQSIYATLNDLWSLDPTNFTWFQLHPQSSVPLGRADPMFTFVPSTALARNQDFLFLFGGWNNSSAGSVGRLQDTWYFFPRNNSWIEPSTLARPSPRSDSTVAFDPKDDLILIYGGFDGTSYLNDLWAFLVQNRTWLQIHPTSGTNPPPLADARMRYDTKQNIFIMFGGNNNFAQGESYNHYDTTWAFNITSLHWSNISPPISPAARDYAHFAYDPDYGVFFLHGGYDDNKALNDTWLYSYGTDTWFQLRPDHSPPARFAGAIAYAPSTKSFVLYGGTANHKVYGDTWAFQYTPQTKVTINIASSIHAGRPVDFSSQVSTPLSDVKSYRWSFGDGGVSDLSNPTHTYYTPATYRVSLNATDALSQNFGSTLFVTVSPSSAGTIVLALLANSVLEVVVLFLAYELYSRLRKPSLHESADSKF